jgi:beta-lactamase superfamily II metal-dependent hydrolase
MIHPPRAEGLLWNMMEWKKGGGKHPHPGWSENERSLVVRGVTPHGSFLVFGDASGKGMKQLAEREDLSADVVVAPHHGGTSGGENYDAKYRWPVVLFSASGTFVKSERLKVYRDAGSNPFITADTGTLTVRFGRTITMESYRGAAAGPQTVDEEDAPDVLPENVQD